MSRSAGRTLLVVAALLLHADVAPGQETTDADRARRVDALFAEWAGKKVPGAVVGVFHDGKIVHARGYGLANIEYGIPMSPKTALRIGSISKQFVAMGVALLAEDGQLTLDDDVRRYLPEMPDYGKTITIRHLLHHTSGIREYLGLVELIGKPEGSIHGYTTAEVYGLLTRQKSLDFTPGTRYSYSNSGYFLASEIIHRVSGKKASDFLREHVFKPLGMKSTLLYDDPDAIVANLAFGYSRKRGGDGHRLDILRSEVVGDLGVVTTVEDFLRWDDNFHRNALGRGRPALIETMEARGRTDDGQPVEYALGLSLGTYRGLRTIGHGGSAVGYVSTYRRFPDRRFAVVVFSNLGSFRTGRMVDRIADIYLAEHLGPAAKREDRRERDDRRRERPPPITLSPGKLAPYAGRYYSEELDYTYELQVGEGMLQLEIRGRTHDVRPAADGTFTWRRRRLTFVRGEDGTVLGFRMAMRSGGGMAFGRVTRKVAEVPEARRER